MSYIDNFKDWPHLLCTGLGCSARRINDLTVIHDFLYDMPEKLGMQRLGTPVVYKITKKNGIDPGITGTQIITTSHISIHSFLSTSKSKKPEAIAEKVKKPLIIMDVFSCKNFDVDLAVKFFCTTFKPKKLEKALIYRLREDEELIEVEDY